MIPKSIYLAKRHKNLSRTEFISRWRKHGVLAMSQPRWVNYARYVHCDLVPDLNIQDTTDEYDGVGMLWFKSPEHFALRNAAADSQHIMEEDELQTFSGYIAPTKQLVVENRPTFGIGGLKLMRFSWIKSQAESSILELYEQSNEQKYSVSSIVDGVARYRANQPSPNDYPVGLKCNLIEEFWFDNIDSLRLGAPMLASLGGVAQTISLVVKENVLWDVNK